MFYNVVANHSNSNIHRLYRLCCFTASVPTKANYFYIYYGREGRVGWKGCRGDSWKGGMVWKVKMRYGVRVFVGCYRFFVFECCCVRGLPVLTIYNVRVVRQCSVSSPLAILYNIRPNLRPFAYLWLNLCGGGHKTRHRPPGFATRQHFGKYRNRTSNVEQIQELSGR